MKHEIFEAPAPGADLLKLTERGQYVVVALADGSRVAVYADGSYLRRMPDGTVASGLMRTENGK